MKKCYFIFYLEKIEKENFARDRVGFRDIQPNSRKKEYFK